MGGWSEATSKAGKRLKIVSGSAQPPMDCTGRMRHILPNLPVYRAANRLRHWARRWLPSLRCVRRGQAAQERLRGIRRRVRPPVRRWRQNGASPPLRIYGAISKRYEPKCLTGVRVRCTLFRDCSIASIWALALHIDEPIADPVVSREAFWGFSHLSR